MIIGSMKEVFLTRAKEIFLFDCRVAGLDPQAVGVYRNVLSSFIRFTGNIRVRQLTSSHISMYIANLSDGPIESDEHDFLVMSHCDIIQTWIHWMYSQKFITERVLHYVQTPRLRSLFPLQFKKGIPYCA